MRDKNLNFIQFKMSVRKYCKNSLPQYPSLLRTAVVNSPTFNWEDYNLHLPRKFHLLRGLAIVHWFLPENLMWRVHLDLWELSLSHLNNKQKIEISLLLHSEEVALKYLYETRRYSSHEIFGNLLGTGCQTLKRMRISKRSKIIIPTQRKRGYHDKGSLRREDKWIESHDFSLTQIQNEKERCSDLLLRTINRIIQTIEELSI